MPTEAELPPVDSLTFDSDFGAFMQPRVTDEVRRAALRKLFADPRFNVMDGLDVYIDDYSKFEPLTEAEARGLAHVQALFDPPRMRVLPGGEAVPVPPGEDEPGTAAMRTVQEPDVEPGGPEAAAGAERDSPPPADGVPAAVESAASPSEDAAASRDGTAR